MSENIMTFEEAIVDSEECKKRHLLLGNGFSIACCPDIFHYGSLFDEADFKDFPNAKNIFDAIQTFDFEKVIRMLEDSAKIQPFYGDKGEDVASEMTQNAKQLKDILVSTIANKHPEKLSSIPQEKIFACRKFLSHFLGDRKTGGVYTLNYDLLLYWTLMSTESAFILHSSEEKGFGHAEIPKKLDCNDGFGNVEDNLDTEYVVWHGETASSSGTRVFFLHGALHLFDAGAELRKYAWIRTGIPLIEQARQAINDNAFPLFVAEGESNKKKEKIRHNAYLYQCLKQLTANLNTGTHCLFIYGHSLAENDEHILQQIRKGRFKKLYVSIYGDKDSDANKEIISRAEGFSSLRNQNHPLDVKFYDAESAKVWG